MKLNYSSTKRAIVIFSLALTSLTNAQGTTPLNASKKSEHFSAVVSNLELGGTQFSYADGAPATSILKTCLDLTMNAYGDSLLKGVNQQKIENLLKLGAVKASGSSITNQGDFYHYRSFSYMPDTKSALTVAYGDAAPSVALQYAPSGADLVFEFHLDGKNSAQPPELIDALGPNLGQKYSLMINQQREQSELYKRYLDVTAEMDSRIAVILDLNPKDYATIPGSPVNGQVFVTITNAKDIWKKFRPFIAEKLDVKQNAQGEYVTLREVLAPGLFPILQYDKKKEQIYIATCQKYLLQCLDVKGKGLSSDPEYKKLSHNLPETYANMVYVSPAVAKLAIAQADYHLSINEDEIPREMLPGLQTVMAALKDSPIRKTGSLYVVHYGNKGTLHIANSPLYLPEGSNTMVTAGVGMTAISGLFVGAKYYKEAADKSACIVNLTSIHKATRAVQNIEGLKVGDPLSWELLVGPNKPLLEIPTCPSGGTYTLSKTFPKQGTPACTCDHPEHAPKDTQGW